MTLVMQKSYVRQIDISEHDSTYVRTYIIARVESDCLPRAKAFGNKSFTILNFTYLILYLILMNIITYGCEYLF